jgi:hypothetical protein
VGCRKPPNRFPWKDADAEIKYCKWQREYEVKAGAYSVCELMDVFGKNSDDVKIKSVVPLHDKYTLAKTAPPWRNETTFEKKAKNIAIYFAHINIFLCNSGIPLKITRKSGFLS